MAKKCSRDATTLHSRSEPSLASFLAAILPTITAPHYDIHTYRVSPEFRTCMECDLLPGTPVCDFRTPEAQTTQSGRDFFTPVVSDIPLNFQLMSGDNVPVMGGHAWDPAEQPANAGVWAERKWPVWCSFVVVLLHRQVVPRRV